MLKTTNLLFQLKSIYERRLNLLHTSAYYFNNNQSEINQKKGVSLKETISYLNCERSALSCIKTNEYSSALPYLQQSIDIQKQIFHSDHLNLTFTYDQIGFVYEKLNQPNEALSFYELSLNIRKKILPNDHIDIAESYDNMANVFIRKLI
ncbi:unnamed protein product [Adineta steineri]|uniref:Uncharacterized protein n=1 Tax=Adineta steineri TaxID=433720 RepID=A0A815H9Z1_9BILA|nr:unnamed protein product [Adineta steineri]